MHDIIIVYQGEYLSHDFYQIRCISQNLTILSFFEQVAISNPSNVISLCKKLKCELSPLDRLVVLYKMDKSIRRFF